MKVIAGKFKGRNLEFRTRRGLRVTSQKVKEAMFSMIGDNIIKAVVLDLFCGYGTLGIEAISRGAKEVTFVETDTHTVKQLKYFLEQLDVAGQATLIRRDAIKAVKHCKENSFDIVFMDPPYHINYEEKALKVVDKYKIIKPGGICILEHYSKNSIPDRVGDLVKFKEKKYGDTSLSIFEIQPEEVQPDEVQPEE
ncbi:MAG: 16S rRNA (guanine(966)-N(2))-methyltransferase RsmD [Candidatus Eremiobacteraeota bacterium]|nr:16S rRNA (guanine(966)-N(2))-methyltransferase RsmD [Candidatus Eremiobacteraeota bacterium]